MGEETGGQMEERSGEMNAVQCFHPIRTPGSDNNRILTPIQMWINLKPGCRYLLSLSVKSPTEVVRLSRKMITVQKNYKKKGFELFESCILRLASDVFCP